MMPQNRPSRPRRPPGHRRTGYGRVDMPCNTPDTDDLDIIPNNELDPTAAWRSRATTWPGNDCCCSKSSATLYERHAMYLRPILQEDREPLAALLRHTDNFNPTEVEVALGLVDDAINRPEESGYRALVAVKDDESEIEEVMGYACFGKTPMTESAYDLYWIVVDGTYRGHGVGGRILRALIETLRQSGGTILRVKPPRRNPTAAP
jgi:GNAT superfamily N-acetyltransferase